MLDNFIKHQTLISEECSSAELKCIFGDICVVNGILVSLYKKILMEAIWIKGYVWKLLIVVRYNVYKHGRCFHFHENGDLLLLLFIWKNFALAYSESFMKHPWAQSFTSFMADFLSRYRQSFAIYKREHFVVGISLLRYCYIRLNEKSN